VGIAAAVVAVAAVAATLLYAPGAARSVWRDTRNGAATPRAEREVAPARVVGILDPEAIVAAAHVIPADATYYVLVGTAAPQSSPNARFYVGFFAASALLPRRAVAHPDDAQWVLSYGGDLSSLGVRYARVVRLGPGSAAAEVAR
jgi:hypothetical protein